MKNPVKIVFFRASQKEFLLKREVYFENPFINIKISGRIKNKKIAKIVSAKNIFPKRLEKFFCDIFLLVAEFSTSRDFFEIETYKNTKARAVKVSINASFAA